MKVAAVIFDLDGTVLDDEGLYGIAFKKVLESLGAKVEGDHPHVSGIGVKENWPGLLKKYHIITNKSYEELAKETQDIYIADLNKVSVTEGFEDFVEGLREAGIQTALATSNIWMIVEDVFHKFGLESYFDCITTGDEVRSKKPEPDLFLYTAGKLGVQKDDCLVIEDAPSGIEAAISAGMKVVGLYRTDAQKKELENANLLVKDFTEISPETLLNL
jgi:HAD superfamily hydrolase (TIGR01509 family)